MPNNGEIYRKRHTKKTTQKKKYSDRLSGKILRQVCHQNSSKGGEDGQKGLGESNIGEFRP